MRTEGTDSIAAQHRTAGGSVSAAARPELMSPAGGPDAAYAAFQYGADAVYCGLPRFSARADAVNFDLASLRDLVGYAHALSPRRRVYVALNTLALERELGDIVESLAGISDAGCDALIVQDLGVYGIVRRHFPELRLHASTQMAIHNRAGVEVLARLGFARATLARELTLDEIRDAAAVPGIEVETFVHGALCFCVSGLCLASSHLLGRSGNRGRCAYVCRNAFAGPGCADAFAFSMKDLALASDVPALAAAGVRSLKIEGRMKSPLYVAAVTRLYRGILDGTLGADEVRQVTDDIRTIFSRPWTRLFMAGRDAVDVIDTEAVGHRGVPIGRAAAVVTRGAVRWLRFTSDRALEVHDGLQVDVTVRGRLYGFGISRLRLAKDVGNGGLRPGRHGTPSGRFARTQRVRAAAGDGLRFETPAGTAVDVELPKDAPAISSGTAIFCTSSQAVKRAYPLARPGHQAPRSGQVIDVVVHVRQNGASADASVRSGIPAGSTARSSAAVALALAHAEEPGRVQAAVAQSFARLGGTGFELGDLKLENPGGWFVPVSRLNALRRDLVTDLRAEVDRIRADRVRGVTESVVAAGSAPVGVTGAPPEPLWCIKVDHAAMLGAFGPDDDAAVHEAVVGVDGETDTADASALAGLVGRFGLSRLRFALPTLTRGWETGRVVSAARSLLARECLRWQIGNLAGLRFLETAAGEAGVDPARLDVSADWPLYALNHCAVDSIRAMGLSGVTLSPEDGFANMNDLLRRLGTLLTVIVYQDTPLFVAEAPVAIRGGEGGGGRGMSLTSSFGQRVEVFRRGHRTVVVAARPFSIAGRLQELRRAGAANLRVDFVNRPYAAESVTRIWRGIVTGRNLPAGHEGNFERGLA